MQAGSLNVIIMAAWILLQVTISQLQSRMLYSRAQSDAVFHIVCGMMNILNDRHVTAEICSNDFKLPNSHRNFTLPPVCTLATFNFWSWRQNTVQRNARSTQEICVRYLERARLTSRTSNKTEQNDRRPDGNTPAHIRNDQLHNLAGWKHWWVPFAPQLYYPHLHFASIRGQFYQEIIILVGQARAI